MDGERVELNSLTISLGADGIVRFVVKPGAHGTLVEAEAALAAVKQLCPDRSVPVLADIRGAGSVDREARTFYSSPHVAEIVAVAAMLVGSPVSRVIGSFFLGINRPAFPTKLFTDEDEALAWLRARRI